MNVMMQTYVLCSGGGSVSVGLQVGGPQVCQLNHTGVMRGHCSWAPVPPVIDRPLMLSVLLPAGPHICPVIS